MNPCRVQPICDEQDCGITGDVVLPMTITVLSGGSDMVQEAASEMEK